MKVVNKIIVQKWWHHGSSLIAKSRFVHGELQENGYLYINYEPNHFGIYLNQTKPNPPLNATNIQGLLRKFANHLEITDWINFDKNDLVLSNRGEHRVQLVLTKSSPPQIELIYNGTSYFRLTTSNCYTKKSNTEMIGLNSPNLIESKLQQYFEVQDEIIESTSNNLDLLSSQQVKIRRQLVRRKKTLTTSQKKHQNQIKIEEKLKEITTIIEQQEGSPTHIKHILIDPDISIGKNISQLYQNQKKLRQSMKLQKQYEDNLMADLASLDHDIKTLSEAVDESVLNDIQKKYKLKDNHIQRSKPKPTTRTPYWTFVLPDQCKILVGKSARDNDVLTKAAKDQEAWLHACNAQGSHVVVVKPLNQLSPQQLRAAAILAIHYSQIGKDRAGEVYVTSKSQVKKTKGLAVGQWLIKKAKSEFYRYTDEELQQLLQLKS